jgi:hypothetical protein
MTINNSTSLMTNQKNAIIMPADKQFKVLQTQEGNALFFSINDADQFFCTREIQGDVNGWGQIDLMQGIDGTPKTFDIAQDLTNNSISIIAVVTDSNNKDHLYVSVGNKNTDTDWTTAPPSLTEIPFDDPDTTHNYDGLPISDIYLAEASTGQYIVADVVTGAFVSRYFVDPSYGISEFGNAWIPHDLSGDLNPGTIINALGFRPNEDIPGIYTFGAIGNETELIYTPLYNETQAGSAISSIVFTMPQGITEASKPLMAVSAANAPFTDLFLTFGGSLYFLANADQTNLGKAPTCIYTHDLLQNMSSLHINNWNGNVVVWGLSTDDNNETQVFIMECPAGSEAVGAADGINGTAWSCPIPLIFGAVNVASFVNDRLGSSVIFAHMGDGSLLQLIEDPITTAWRERSILIPPPLPPAILVQPYESITYTTHLEFVDDYNNPMANTAVAVTASSPISVYIDAVYYNLDTTVPVNVTTDYSGTLNIMQPVDNLGCVCYNVSAAGESVTINPMQDLMAPGSTIAKVTTDADLSVSVTDETNTPSNLLGDNVNDDDKKAAAATIVQLTKAAATMPASGGLKNPPVSTSNPVGESLSASHNPLNRPKGKVYHDPSKHTLFGLDFTGGRLTYFEGIEHMSTLGVALDKDNSLMFHAKAKPGELGLGSFKSWIESKAGKVLRWAKKVVNTVENWVINLGTDVADFFITIAGEVYHFVLNCYHDVVNGLHSLLNTLQTTFEKIKQWVGFVFAYPDILRTHNVMKNIITQYLNYNIQNIASLEDSINSVFTTLENDVAALTGLPEIDDTQQSTSQQNPSPTQMKSAQANWGTHHAKANGNNASGGSWAAQDTGDDPTNGNMTTLNGSLGSQQATFAQMHADLLDIISNYKTTKASVMVEKILGTVLNFILDESKDLLIKVVDVMKSLAQHIVDILTAPIDIPVISYLYKKISGGNEFSILDLVCLVGAIPATIVYKAIEGVAPYPDDSITTQLMQAPDLATINSILSQTNVNGSTNPSISSASADRWAVTIKVGNIAAAAGAVLIDLFTSLKSGIVDALYDNKWLNLCNTASYYLYVLPDAIQGAQTFLTPKSNGWITNFNNVCTWLACIKVGIDGISGFSPSGAGGWGWAKKWGPASPLADFLLNIAWQVPTTATFFAQVKKYGAGTKDTAFEVIDLIGGTAFDLSGICSPWLWTAQQDRDDPDGSGKAGITIMLVLIGGLNLIWGASCVLNSFGPFQQPSS